MNGHPVRQGQLTGFLNFQRKNEFGKWDLKQKKNHGEGKKKKNKNGFRPKEIRRMDSPEAITLLDY